MRSLSGFYNVKTDEEVIMCKARGAFRNKSESPVVGDRVVLSTNNESAIVDEILPRKNIFVRPPLANIDILFFVVSTCEPQINYNVTDKLIAIAESIGIEPVIVITKGDIASSQEVSAVYKKAGFKVIEADYENFDKEQFFSIFKGKISAFCGNSGVGKSNLLNNLLPDLCLETGETSKKLGRGRHTTRAVELFEIGGGYVADTPGFSTVVVSKYKKIPKEQLQMCFREFENYIGKCKFSVCSHTNEPGCAVIQALEEGKIEKTRYNSYCGMYEEALKYKDWEK